LCVELCKLGLIERHLDDPGPPKPDVDSEKLVELVCELRVQLTAAPAELKGKRVVERLDGGSEDPCGSR
jgi:hypothetical protein